MGANISAPSSLAISANVLGDTLTNPNAFNSANTATATINGATGSITANATNNTRFLPVVSTDAATSLTTSQLTITTYSPAPPNGDVTTNPYYSNNANAVNHTVTVVVVQWVQQTVDEVVGWIPFFGSLIESVVETVASYVEEFLNSSTANNASGAFTSSPAIHLNGTLNQPATMNASLTVSQGAGGPVIAANGLTATNDGKGDIVVSNIINTDNNFIDLNANNGTVDGSLSVLRAGSSAINLTNNTAENLIVNGIQIVPGSGSGAGLAIDASSYLNFRPTFTNTSTGGINITNNSGSNVMLDGAITDSSGNVTISDTSGSILGQGGTIQADNISLSAGQSVGSAANPVAATLVSNPNPVAPQLTVSAGSNVNVDAGLIGYGTSAAPMILTNANISSIAAGGTVNLFLAPPLQYVIQTGGAYAIAPVFGTGYTIGSITGNGGVTLTAQGGELVMGVGSGFIGSSQGNVSLAVNQGDAYIASINAPAGTATVNALDTIIFYGGTGIAAKNINLTSQTGAIGNNWNPLQVTTPGALTSQSAQGTYLVDNSSALDLASMKASSGNIVVSDTYSLSLGNISDTAGNVSLSSNASILNAGTGVNVIGNVVTLDAGTGTVGATGTPVTVTANQVNAAAVSDIDLSANGGTLNLGTLDSTGGNVSLTNNAGISSVVNTTNITANNVNLVATGLVGPINTAATGQLSAQGAFVTVTQVTGNLSINSVTAQNNVSLFANNGNINLGSVSTTLGNITVGASQSILNALGTCSTCVNLTGYTTTLTATNGSIGTQAAPIEVNNKNVATGLNGSDLLNGSAAGDVYLNEVTGNLISKQISSSSGNIGIQVLAGNAKLGNVLGNGSVTISDTGNQMNITDIVGANSNTTSPTNVSLGVSAVGGTLTVGQISASQSVSTQADNTTLSSVVATNTATGTTLSALQADGLVLNMSGGTGGVATALNATVTPCATCSAANPVVFDKYLTQNGAVTTTSNWLEFGDAVVGANATFTNSYLKVQVANKGTATPLAPWQLFVVGNQLQDNAANIENVTSTLINNNPYTSPFPPATVFSFLWTFFGATP